MDLKTALSNCDAKRDHNYRQGADNFTITTREYAILREVAMRPEVALPSARYARITIRNPNGRAVRLSVCGKPLTLGAGESADYCLTDEQSPPQSDGGSNAK